MAFFDKLKKSPKNVEKTGWDNLAEDANHEKNEQSDSALIRRRILAAMAMGGKEHIERSALEDQNVEISDDIRSDIVDTMARREDIMTDAKKRELLMCVDDPMQEPGFDWRNIDDSRVRMRIEADLMERALNIIAEIDDKHELKILSSTAGLGFNEWRRCTPRTVMDFTKRFPTPMDFEQASERFLAGMKKMYGAEGREKYEAAMRSFEQKVYGEKYVFYQEMKAIDSEVQARREQIERERSAEWIPGEACVWQTSRNQAKDGLVSRDSVEGGMWADDSCEDSFFSSREKQVYGVFDGAGGMKKGRLASQIAAGVLKEYCDKYEMKRSGSLVAALDAASKRVCETPDINGGCSTGVLASVLNLNGFPKLAYATIGDSRLYIVDKKGKARLITQDEAKEGYMLTNAIGVHNPIEDALCHCSQFGEIDLHEGDRVVLCSDGITGDRGADLMSEEELGKIVHRSHGVVDASKNLIAAARKNDDRTAIVFMPRI